MKESVACTLAGHAHTSDTLGNFSTNVTGYVGKSGNYYYTYVQKFIVPDFEGGPGKLTFRLYLASSYSGGHMLRAAVVTSLENFPDYVHSRAPGGAVEDAYQVAAGETPTFENMTSQPKAYTFSLDGRRIRPGTCYLILWASTAVGMTIQSMTSGYGSPETTLTVWKGIGRLDTGEAILPGQIRLDTGTEWVPTVMWMDTGTEWILGN